MLTVAAQHLHHLVSLFPAIPVSIRLRITIGRKKK